MFYRIFRDSIYMVGELRDRTNKAKGNSEAVAYLASISPVASQHLNLSGLYQFSDIRTEIDVDDVVAKMEEILHATLEGAPAQK